MNSGTTLWTSWRRSFLAGVRDVAPMVLGIIPFGMVYGASAASVGLTPPQAGLFSVIVFAGAAQLAALQIIADQGPVLVVIFTGLAVNLRMLMYSAAIAPHFSGRGTLTKLALSYVLTDQAFALSLARYGTQKEPHKAAYYLGTAMSLWVTWQIFTMAGIVLGASLPASFSLEFTVPLTFLALLFPALKSRPHYITAVVSGVVAVAASGLPYNLGLISGAVAGLLAGFFLGGKPK